MGSETKEDEIDLPSDFFDDFNKAEFIEGLSVIDSWDDDIPVRASGARPNIDSETVDNLKDLRELIGDIRDDRRDRSNRNKEDSRKRGGDEDSRSRSVNRRDPEKTNEAIKKDKDLKVKEYLAKTLESSDDIKPPGTELDDFFDKGTEISSYKSASVLRRSRSPRDRKRRISPQQSQYGKFARSPISRRRSPRRSPFRSKRNYSPKRRSQRSRSPYRRSPIRRSPIRRSPIRRSPIRRSPLRRSPIRRSPHRRSPHRRSPNLRSPVRRSPHYHRSPSYRSTDEHLVGSCSYTSPDIKNYPVSMTQQEYGPGYTYPNTQMAGSVYPGGYHGPFGYMGPPAPPMMPGPDPISTYIPPIQAVMAPQPVPAPEAIPAPIDAAPKMVPAPSQISPALSTAVVQSSGDPFAHKMPYDALAQLLADGKISKEDYLKLTPNKGVGGSLSSMDLKEKVELLSHCHSIISKLDKLHLPNRLIMHQNIVSQEPKCLPQKYCSPLKRQPVVEFHFTQATKSSLKEQNKSLINSIISTTGLAKVLGQPKKKESKNMKDAAVQTTKPFCEVCEIREIVKKCDMGTVVERERFSSTVHTQVVEQDLISSKAVFRPGGGVADSTTMSMAHMTPAQIVSQLAARAKTLQTTTVQHQPNQYDYDNGGSHYDNYNYRYRH